MIHVGLKQERFLQGIPACPAIQDNKSTKGSLVLPVTLIALYSEGDQYKQEYAATTTYLVSQAVSSRQL